MGADYSRLIMALKDDNYGLDDWAYYTHTKELREDYEFQEDWDQRSCEGCGVVAGGVDTYYGLDYADPACTVRNKHDWPHQDLTYCEDCLAQTVLDTYIGTGWSESVQIAWFVR